MRRRRGASPTAPRCFLGESVWCRACRCRRVVKSDMRGLVTAGRTFSWSGAAGLEIERNRCSAMVAHRTDAGHSKRCRHTCSSGTVWVAVSRRGRPATSTSRPARGRSRCWRPRTFLRGRKPAQRVCRRWLLCRGRGRPAAAVPAAPQPRRADRGAVMPGRLDQQAAGMAVAGLGDRALTGGPEETRTAPTPGRRRSSGQLAGASRRSRRPGRTRSTWRLRADTHPSGHHRGELAVGGQPAITAFEAIAAAAGSTGRRPRHRPAASPAYRTARGAATSCLPSTSPTAVDDPWRRSNFDIRCRAPIKSPRQSSRARTRSRAASWAALGITTSTI